MYNKKMLFMSHLPPPGAGVEDNPGRAGSGKTQNMCTLYIKMQFLFHCMGKLLKCMLLRLGCTFNSKWHYLNHNSICTAGQVLKINKIYTYVEDGCAGIVRLLDVYKDKGYLYCTLYFFTRNKITTVSQILNPDDHLIWRIMENEEYDEIVAIRLWQEVDNRNEILESEF
jgi:hypothetical protein